MSYKDLEAEIKAWANLEQHAKEQKVLEALSNNDEGGGQVYLENAFSEVAHIMNRHQWAGYLSALAQEGKYSPQGDQEFGLIL